MFNRIDGHVLELSSISQLLVKASRQSSGDALSKLIASGELLPGTVLNAVVGRSLTLNTQQRDHLIALWQQQSPSPQMTGKGSYPDPSPNKSSDYSAHGLLEQASTQGTLAANTRALLQTPVLKAIELKMLDARQWVISEHALISGQTVQVKLREDKQLQLLISTHKAETQKPAQAERRVIIRTGPTSVSTTSPASQAMGGSLDLASPNKVQSNTLMQAQIRHYLRQTLPYGQNLSHVIGEFQRVLTLVNKLPKVATSVSDTQIGEALESLIKTIKPPKTLSQPALLKSAIAQSGFFYESTLPMKVPFSSGQATQALPSSTPLSAPPPKTLTASASPEVIANTEEKTGKAPGVGLSPDPAHREKNSEDIKALLNTLLKLTETPQTGSQPGLNVPKPSASLLFHALAQLQGLDTKTQEAKALSDTAKQQIHSLARSALAKITGLQLQQLMQQTTETGFTGNTATLEIPVRIGEQVLPLTLYLQESILQEDEDSIDREKSARNEQEMNKQWQVFLEFDLGEQGTFASEIQLMGNRVQAKFWSESQGLRRQAKEQLQQLKQKIESSGIEVTEIVVSKTAPPSRQTSLGYSLVNVTT